jgi:hypothetical protein
MQQMRDMMRDLTKPKPGIAAGVALALIAAAPAMAVEDKIYPYASHGNHCPAGLQPISISGVICCGMPNQHQTYQQVMQHPTGVRYDGPVNYGARPDCREGDKGCS